MIDQSTARDIVNSDLTTFFNQLSTAPKSPMLVRQPFPRERHNAGNRKGDLILFVFFFILVGVYILDTFVMHH